MGADRAPLVAEAVLELAERGVHRVLRRPPGPVRHHVDGLPRRRIPLSRRRRVVVVVLPRGRGGALLLGQRRPPCHRRRDRRRAAGPPPGPESARAGPLAELRARAQRGGGGRARRRLFRERRGAASDH